MIGSIFFFSANTIFMKVFKKSIGFLIGIINSLLGSGGGLITVPYLTKEGLSQQSAQATSTFIILPLTLLSTFFYMQNHYFDWKDAVLFLPGGILGAILGGIFLKKIPANALKIIFSLFMIYAGVRLMIK